MKERSKGLGGFLTELVHGLVGMPKTMRQLAVVQFFTWIALFCMWIYWTPATARQVFGGDPADEAAWSKVIETAGAWTGICFATYNLVCFFFSFILLAISRRISAKTIHIVCLDHRGAGSGVRPLHHEPAGLVGFHGRSGHRLGIDPLDALRHAVLSAIPAEKMGFYMGVFNFFIVIPQVLVALAMGPLIGGVFGGDSMMAVLSGGICLLIAAAATTVVDYKGGKVVIPGGDGH